MTDQSTPASTLPSDDAGAQTASRFAYQWTQAAILACGLFDDTSDIVEVFCEQHDDILVCYSSRQYAAWQVKTRNVDGPPFEANEETVIAALSRFATLEASFPGQFREFVLATSHVFLTGKKTGSCLPYLLQLAQEATDESTADPHLKKLIAKLCKRTRLTAAIVLSSLKKCRCDPTLPKLGDVKNELINALAEAWPGASAASRAAINSAADALIADCGRASSLDHAQALPGYLSASMGRVATELHARIDGKRLTRDRIDRILLAALSTTPLLAGSLPKSTLDAMTSTKRLSAKLEAGGFSITSIISAQNLRDAADHQSVEWMHRFGDAEALKRRDHVRSLVLRDCADAFERSRNPTRTFGVAMLEHLRKRFDQRRGEVGATLFDCLDEHLEGYAYELTGECSVRWSNTTPAAEGE